MKGWLVGLALVAVVVASGIGLWTTWESTQSSSANDLSIVNRNLLTTTTSAMGPVTTTTVPAAPACAAGDEVITTDPTADWATTVIDTSRRLPDDLAALRTAAEANGTPIAVISGYRSFSYQQNLFDQRAAQVGAEEAALRTARPGHSEHQLGTAVDVLDLGVGDLTTAFGATPAGQWVAAHAHEFGFVVSYPDGARDRTCYEYEPWHLRYVGRDVAGAIHDAGVTAREWMLASGTAAGD